MQANATSPSAAHRAPIIAVLPPVRRDPGTPTLSEMLAEPITRAVMRADRVSATDLLRLRRTLRARQLAA